MSLAEYRRDLAYWDMTNVVAGAGRAAVDLDHSSSLTLLHETLHLFCVSTLGVTDLDLPVFTGARLPLALTCPQEVLVPAGAVGTL
jgi:hypothetical protein